jgi:hypothetical protein
MSFGERFLSQPDLFPARPSGEAWGARAAVLDLPGGPYRFTGLSEAQAAIVTARFPGRRLPEATPGAVTAAIFRASPTDFLAFDTRGWEYALDTDFQPDSVRLAGISIEARLDWRPALSGSLWTPDGGEEPFAGIFENFCRVLAAYRLLETGGAILHSAGVVAAGGAFVFLGRSGAGKTTVSRLCEERGGTVLSDDMNALVLDGGSAQVAALPFTGDLGDRGGVPSRHPLHALVRLEKSADDALAPLSRAEIAACLFACSPFVNADPHRREALLGNLLRLAAAGGGGWALRFSLDGGMWSILGEKWPI